MPLFPVSPKIVVDPWPEMDEWCAKYPVLIDLASADDFDATWIQIRRPAGEGASPRAPDTVEWYQITKQEAANLHDNDGRHLTGDVEQMIADIDRVEITPTTRCEIFKRYIAQSVADSFDGMLVLAMHGKL